MCFLCGSPALYYLIILIENRQFRTRNLSFSCDIRLTNLYFCHIIFHLMLLNLCCILYCKSNTFCSNISICRFCLCHGVFLTNNQFFDHMGFLRRSPFIYCIAIWIRHFQVCTWKFFTCCQVCFGQLHCGWLIFKSKVVAYFCLVFSGIFKGKFLYFFCCNKSVRRKDFFHIVFSIYR